MGYFSQGALNVDIAYNLPVYLRNFYYKQLVEFKKQESDEINKAKGSSPKGISRPF